MTETRIRVKTTLGVTDHNLLDNRFEDNQHTINAISGLEEALESKQDILTAGDNVTIEEGVISATDTTYTAGENVAISEENVISASVPEYTAGENISISNGVISATDTTYTAGTGIAITNGVISNTQTSAEWGNIDGDMNSQTDLKNALDAKANSLDLAAVATSGSYTDLADKPNIANGVLTIQKNGTTVDTFTANSSDNKTVNLIIPTSAADVSAMPDSVKYGTSITVSIDSTDYRMTVTLKDQDGNTLGTAQVIDLPLESVVVSGSYDSTNKNVVLTLQDGSDITFSVADLVSGLQSEITAQNKLDADLVDDSTSVNKFVTASDKTTWNGKQDTISDLDTIRAGANAGATAIQAGDLATVATSGNYSDLNGKPNLATVATTGAYSDLSGTPVIPTVPQNDNSTISLDASDKLQAIGFKEARTDTAMRVWHGTEQQWEQGGGQVTFYNWQNVSATLTTGTFPDYSGTDLQFKEIVNGDGIALLYSEDSNDYYTTTDGINWTKRQFNTGKLASNITYGNNIFLALNHDKTISMSSDGISWIDYSTTLQNILLARNCPISYCNGQFMINTDSTSTIAYSIDNGATWNYTSVNFNRHRIVYGNNTYLAIATNTNSTVKYSSDGENWSYYTNTSTSSKQLMFINGKFFNLYITNIDYSTDGNAWTHILGGRSYFVSKNNKIYCTYYDRNVDIGINEINTSTLQADSHYIINGINEISYIGSCGNKILFLDKTKGVCGNLDLDNTTVSNTYTTVRNPTTSSQVYSAPNVQSALTVTTGGSSSITLSDSNTYNYNQNGNQTTYTSVGAAHPNYLCNIDGVGVKIGTTDIANKSLTYSAGTNVSISNTGVISAIDTTYPVFGGADGSVAGHSGLVPTPANTDNNKFLKGDGTWATVSGGGTTYTAGNGINITNNVISVDSQSTSEVTLATVATTGDYSDLNGKPTAFTGATSSVAGSAGLVPAPTTSDVDKFLKGDGTWAAVSGGGSGIQNTATHSESLTILGTPNTTSSSINIGKYSESEGGYNVAVGYSAKAYEYAVCIGSYDNTYPTAYKGCVTIGSDAVAGDTGESYCVAIGYQAHASYSNSIAIGGYSDVSSYYSIAIGGSSSVSSSYSIAIGYNAVSTQNYEFVVGGLNPQNDEAVSFKLMDLSTGKIPNDRINGATGSFTSQDGKTVTVTNGVITSIV